MPLVLHGGSGIPENQIKKAISLGVSKINVNTECQLAFASGLRQYILDNKDIDTANKGFDPRKLLKAGSNEIIKTCKEKFLMFGCMNTAK
jgi:fructose-bisphosphate aldolase class II